jgi:hypothetical protein
MSPRRFVLPVFFLFFLVSSRLIAQDANSRAVSSDPSALAILRQSIAAMGGGNLAQVVDLTLTGEVSEKRAMKTSSGSIQIKMIGKELCKVRIQNEDGESQHIVNGVQSRRVGQGEDVELPVHAAMNHHLQYVPILSNLLSIDDLDLSVKFIGQETVDGRNVYHLHTEKIYPQQAPQYSGVLAKLSSTDFFIDKENFLLVMRTQRLPSLNDATNTLPIEFHYSDYRSARGILVPYSIAVRVNQQDHLQIHITSVATNSGIKPEEFEVRQ